MTLSFLKSSITRLCLALLLCVVAFGLGTSIAQAQAETPLLPGDPLYIVSDTDGGGATGDTSIEQVQQNIANDVSANNTPTAYKETDYDTAYNGIMIQIMRLFAWLVGVAAITLDNTVYATVVHMGNYVNNLSAIGVTWRILRDIGNIILIFGFLAIGISTILNTERIGYGKKMLPTLLIVAVFLNFSLFIAEAVIDTGNLFATQFYTQINGGLSAGAKGFDEGSLLRVQNEGISNKIMGQLGLQTIYSNALDPNTEIFKGGHPWLIGFMGVLLFIVLAFVMFSLAFILIARFVALIFIIILAPIGFAGLVVPQLADKAKQWWHQLFNQTLVAPVLLLLLYVALRVITDVSFLTGFGVAGGAGANGAWTAFVTNDLTNFSAVVLSFLVAMGLLLAVTVFAKQLAAFGAGWATKMGGKLSFGLTAAGMRNTAGWALTAGARGFRNTRIARVPVVGRSVSRLLDSGGKASFDVRGATAFGGLKAAGIDAGTAQKGGFSEAEKKATKAREDYAKTLGQTGNEKKAQKIEESRQKLAEDILPEIRNQNRKETQELQAKHKREQEEENRKVSEAQGALSKLEEDQRKGATISQEALATARQSVADARVARDKKIAEQQKEQEEFKKAHEQALKVRQEEITARKEAVANLKKAPQEGYAKGLTWGPGSIGYRNTKAAENIRNEAKKSKSDKDMELLKKIIEQEGKPKEEPKKDEAKPEEKH